METVHVDTLARCLRQLPMLTANWERFYLSLNLDNTHIEELRDMFASSQNPLLLIRTILQMWLFEQGERATVRNIKYILEKTDCRTFPGLCNIFQLSNVLKDSYDNSNKTMVSKIFSYDGHARHKVCLSPLLNLLSQAANRHVVIISIHGRISSRKAYFANQLLNYFYSTCSNTRDGRVDKTYCFDTSCIGTWIWNKLFTVESNGEKLGVIITYTNDAIGEKLPCRLNGTITCFPFLLSSVSIVVGVRGGDVYHWIDNVHPEFMLEADRKHHQAILLPIENTNITTTSKRYAAFTSKLLNLSNITTIPLGIEPLIFQEMVNSEPFEGIVLHSLLEYFKAASKNWSVLGKNVLGQSVTGEQLKDIVIGWADSMVPLATSYISPDYMKQQTIKSLSMVKIEEFVEHYKITISKYFGNATPTSLTLATMHNQGLIMERTSLDEVLQKFCKPEQRIKYLDLFSERINNIQGHYEKLRKTQSQKPYREVGINVNGFGLADTQKRIHKGISTSHIIGKMDYKESAVLGRGSKETVVYKGRFGERNVAIKRLNRVHYDIARAQNEVEIMINSDSHPNIIRYFDQELHNDFILIALELCDMSLAMWTQDKSERQLTKICRREILMQCSEGLACLHEKKIIHRDIKPENILLVVDTTNGNVCVKISDFGLCKQLPVEKTSFTLTSHSGSYGWQAPEVLRFVAKSQSGNPSSRMSCKSDIFSLGCVFYSVLTNGEHPFGDIIRRQTNILDGKLDWDEDLLKRNGFGEAGSLIKSMLSLNREDRPPASAITKHYLHWSPSTISSFLVCINKCREAKKYPGCTDAKCYLEKWKRFVFNQQDEWGLQLGQPLQLYLEELANSKHNVNKYNFNRVDDMIRLIRNRDAPNRREVATTHYEYAGVASKICGRVFHEQVSFSDSSHLVGIPEFEKCACI